MIFQKKKIVISVFFMIYLVIFSVLAWLLFFNSGLDIIEAEKDGIKQVFVTNKSSREITNIIVKAKAAGSEIEIAKIKKLAPKEMFPLDMSIVAGKGTIVLSASAQFYQKVEKGFFSGESFGDLLLSVQMPQVAFKDTTTPLIVQACNKSSFEKKVTVSLELSEDFFSGQQPPIENMVKASECADLKFEVSPLKTGTTTIYFNINANDFSEKIERQLEVK